MLKKLIIILLILIAFISILGTFYNGDLPNWHTVLGIIGRYGLVSLSLTGGGIITYHFFRAFFDKHKKRKLICYSLTAISLVIGITIYTLVNRPTNVVHMKEDVLYIRPKSIINDIYDGSENDPNFKQDTTNK